MIGNYEPAVRGAAARLAPVRNQMDARGYDRDDYEQELRLKAQVAQTGRTDKPFAYVHSTIRNAEISFGRKHAVGVAHYAPFDDFDLADEEDVERQHAFVEVIELLRQHFTADEMEQLYLATAQVTTGNQSRTTEYRRNVALFRKMRQFLENEGINAKLLGFSVMEDEITQTPTIKILLAKRAATRHIFQHQREHTSCACFSQPAPDVRTTECEPEKLCGSLIGNPMMRLEDGTILELPLTPKANQPWDKRKRHRRDRDRTGWDHADSSTLWTPFSVLEFSPRKASSSKTGGSPPSGGGSSSDGGGGGRPRKAAPGASICIACEGSGKSSKGHLCSPCRGTGASRAAEHRFPDEQHPALSGTADRQIDLFAAKTENVDPVGGAHVSSEMAEGGDSGTENRLLDTGPGEVGQVGGSGVRDETPGGILRGDGQDGQQPHGQQGGDRVRDHHGDHGGQATPSPTPAVSPQPDVSHQTDVGLQRGEVLPAVDKPTAAEVQAAVMSYDVLEKERVLGPYLESKPAAHAGPDGGWVVDLTTMAITRVDWKNVVPLCRTPQGYDVLQLNFWSPIRNAWVWLVAQHTGRKMPAGAIEVTPDEWLAFDRKHHLPGQSPIPLAMEGWKAPPTGSSNGMEPLVTSSKGAIHQLSWWEPQLGKWVVLTQARHPRRFPDAVELDLDEFFQIMRLRVGGMPAPQAYHQVKRQDPGDGAPF